MFKAIFFATVLAAATASGVTIGLSPYSHPVQSLYHAQDNYGQYVYGYATPTSTKTETKTSDGVTRGGYSYIDSNGHLQTVQYVADALHGFRVAATNLPRDLPDVAHAKAEHLAEFARIANAHQTVRYVQPVRDLPEVEAARARHLATLGAAYANAGAVPEVVRDLPEVVRARAQHLAIVEATRARDAQVGGVQGAQEGARLAYRPLGGALQQYRAQDGHGQYSYGYVEPLSAKSEVRGADGVTRGGYSYIDANGIVQSVSYVADVHGFRVAGTNLPVAPQGHFVADQGRVVAPQGHVVAPQGHIVAAEGAPTGHGVLYSQQVYY